MAFHVEDIKKVQFFEALVKLFWFVLVISMVSCDFIFDVLQLNTEMKAISIDSDSTKFYVGQQYKLIANYKNPKSEGALIEWTTDGGEFLKGKSDGDTVVWLAPKIEDTVTVAYKGTSDKEGSIKHERQFIVMNRAPIIYSLNPSLMKVIRGNSVTFEPVVSDPDGETLTYEWTVSGGALREDSVNRYIWESPVEIGTYGITLKVSDINGHFDLKTDSLVVYRIQGSVLVVNSGENNLKQYSEDGLHIRTIDDDKFVHPKKIVIDQENLNAWIMDDAANILFIYDKNGKRLNFFKNFKNLIDIEFDERTRGCWAIDDTSAFLIDRTGFNVIKTVVGFVLPRLIRKGDNNDIFVADSRNVPTLYRVDTSNEFYYSVRSGIGSAGFGSHSKTTGYGDISDVAWDKVKKKLWVIDQNKRRIVQMNKDSTSVLELSFEFTRPYFVAQDNNRGLSWVNDNHEIVVFEGVNGARITTNQRFSPIGGIAVITFTSEKQAWISDELNHRLIRINASGNVISEVLNVNIPKYIAVYNGN